MECHYDSNKNGLKALPTGGYQEEVKNVKSGNRPIILQVIPSYNSSSTLAPNAFIYKIPFILVVMVDTDNTQLTTVKAWGLL